MIHLVLQKFLIPSILDACGFWFDLFYGLWQLLLEASFLKYFIFHMIFERNQHDPCTYVLIFKTFYLFKATCCYRAIGI